jgi:hypothetical protein
MHQVARKTSCGYLFSVGECLIALGSAIALQVNVRSPYLRPSAMGEIVSRAKVTNGRCSGTADTVRHLKSLLQVRRRPSNARRITSIFYYGDFNASPY